jgi:hypothetical protein
MRLDRNPSRCALALVWTLRQRLLRSAANTGRMCIDFFTHRDQSGLKKGQSLERILRRESYPAIELWQESAVLWSHRPHGFDAHDMFVDERAIQHLLASHMAFEDRFQRSSISPGRQLLLNHGSSGP